MCTGSPSVVRKSRPKIAREPKRLEFQFGPVCRGVQIQPLANAGRQDGLITIGRGHAAVSRELTTSAEKQSRLPNRTGEVNIMTHQQTIFIECAGTLKAGGQTSADTYGL